MPHPVSDFSAKARNGLKITSVKVVLIAVVISMIALSAISTRGRPSSGSSTEADDLNLIAFQTDPSAKPPTPQGTLQRRTAPPATTDRGTQCQRVQADWVNNLPSRSFVTGALVFFICLVFLFTPLGFSTPFVRLFCAVLVAIVLGPTIVGLQKQAALKICPEPTSFLGIMTSDLFIWTLAGIVTAALLLMIIRYPFTRRRLNTRPTA